MDASAFLPINLSSAAVALRSWASENPGRSLIVGPESAARRRGREAGGARGGEGCSAGGPRSKARRADDRWANETVPRDVQRLRVQSRRARAADERAQSGGAIRPGRARHRGGAAVGGARSRRAKSPVAATRRKGGGRPGNGNGGALRSLPIDSRRSAVCDVCSKRRWPRTCAGRSPLADGALLDGFLGSDCSRPGQIPQLVAREGGRAPNAYSRMQPRAMHAFVDGWIAKRGDGESIGASGGDVGTQREARKDLDRTGPCGGSLFLLPSAHSERLY